MRPTHLALCLGIGLLVATPGCTETMELFCDGTVVDGLCVPGTDPPSIPDTRGSNPDIQPIGWDTSQEDQDTIEEPVDWTLCAPALRAIKPIGAGCELDCECETGFCYDEGYLGDFRFCTRRCEGGCNDGVEGEPLFTCLLFGGKLADRHDLVVTDICQRICKSLDDCQALSTTYDACGTDKPGTVWGETTLSLANTCVVIDTLE